MDTYNAPALAGPIVLNVDIPVTTILLAVPFGVVPVLPILISD